MRFVVKIFGRHAVETTGAGNAEAAYAAGRVFRKGHLLDDTQLAREMVGFASDHENGDGTGDPRRLAELLRDVNGFFALAVISKSSATVAVDKMRSIPLFYSVNPEQRRVFISDRAEWLKDQLGVTNRVPMTTQEFLLTGYVTGSDTLYEPIRQVQAGELVRFTASPTGIEVHRERYFELEHDLDQEPAPGEAAGPAVTANGATLDEDDPALQGLFEAHDEVAVRAVERLIEIADGREIVIPLSGGYDSRLVALLLKRLGHPRVTAFTYGQPGNTEAVVSKNIAVAIGIPWLFVPYTHELWADYFNSPERHDYYLRSFNLSSVPHLQDWPAVAELKKNGEISENAIFVPGHTGDFISGGHIPLDYSKIEEIGQKRVVADILGKHYVLWPQNRHALYREFGTRIAAHLPGECRTAAEAANAYERWDWQERQAKFIVNSVRAYEFWGYDWWLPLWDSEYIDFWSRVPLRYRFDRILYKEYVRQLETQVLGSSSLRPVAQNPTSPLRELLLKVGIYPLAVALRNRLLAAQKRDLEYNQHMFAWYGLVPRDVFDRLFSGTEHITSFQTYELIHGGWEE